MRKNRDGEILRFIESYWDKKGYAPSVRDICTALGFKSPATAAHYLRRMREQGLVEYEDRIPRTVRVTPWTGYTSASSTD